MCDRPRKDTDPSEWKEDRKYPPTIKELAAYVDRETGNNLGEEYLYHQKVINLLISSNLWGEMPKALNHENLINIACFTNLELQRVSQYYHQHGAEKFQDSINHIYDQAYTANSLHNFIIHLIKNFCPIRESSGGLGVTPYPLIVTTCFDRTLEGSFEKEKLPFDLVSYTSSEKQFVYQKFELQNEKIICTEEAPITPKNKDKKEFTSLLQERPAILRIYGPVKWKNTQNGENFAISEDHFLDYLAIDISALLPVKLWNKLVYGRLWFLGYDLSYWYLRFIIRKLRQAKRQAKTDISQWWAVQEKEGILDRNLWKKNRVSFFGGREIGSFEEYLRDVKAEVEKYQKNELDQLPTRPNRR